MSDYLVKCLWKGVADVDQQQDAAARIEELEAKLAKVADALTNMDALDPEGFVHGCSQSALAGLILRMGATARTTLEELKGHHE